MLLVLGPVALAAPLEARIGKTPFVPVAVLAGPAPTRPGTMWVMLSDAPVTCDDAPGHRPSQGARALTVGFLDTQPGTTSREIYGTSASVSGLATLVSMPSAVGERGRVSFAMKGKKDRLAGEVEFVLCAPIAAKPAMVPELTPVERTLSEPSMFDGELPRELKIRIALPIGWTETPPDAYAPQARFVGPDGPGAHAFHWTYRTAADGPWTHTLDVLRQEPEWPSQVRCHLATDEAGAAVLIEPLRAACAEIERIP